jgi:hypothetical protein
MIVSHRFPLDLRGHAMDEATLRGYIERHADAAVRGDMDALAADFTEELRPQLPRIAQALPQPITKAELLSLDIGDPLSVAMSGTRVAAVV